MKFTMLVFPQVSSRLQQRHWHLLSSVYNKGRLSNKVVLVLRLLMATVKCFNKCTFNRKKKTASTTIMRFIYYDTVDHDLLGCDVVLPFLKMEANVPPKHSWPPTLLHGVAVCSKRSQPMNVNSLMKIINTTEARSRNNQLVNFLSAGDKNGR
jgi:hypothetical protein